MGLFEKLFPRGGKSDQAIRGYFQTLTAYSPVFYTRAGGIYEAAETRAAIHAFATHCSKLKPNLNGPQKSRLERRLQFAMSPWQTTSQFLYRTATIFEVENTAFLVPVLDERDRTVGAFPVLPSRCEIVEGNDGKLYLRYEFSIGKHAAVEFDRCAVLTKMQYRDDFFGEGNEPLRPTLDLIDTQDQGIEAGIKNAAAVRFLARLGSAIRPEDLKAEQQRFRELNLGQDNAGGVLIVDTKYAEVKQLEAKPFVVDADQMKTIKESVYEYFGCSEKILRNEWDEQVWTAYYEGKVEPFALQLSLALTQMFFSDREVALGNEIFFSSNRLQFASTKDKVEIITQLFDRGMICGDEGREMLQMPPLPNGQGQKYFIRGEYVDQASRALRSVQEEEDPPAGDRAEEEDREDGV